MSEGAGRLAAAGAILGLVVACGDGGTTPATGGGSPGDGGGGLGGAGGAATGRPSTVGPGSGGQTALPPSFEVTGVVVDEDGAPVAEAYVLQGGKSDEPPLLTASDGSFALVLTYPGYGVPGVVAAKEGYRAAGEEFVTAPPTEPITLVIDRVEVEDNTAYEWQPAGEGNDPSTNFCGHCHERFAEEHTLSKHRQAAKNPLVQDLYAGVSQHGDATSCADAGGTWKVGLVPGTAGDTTNKCYLGAGVLPDLNEGCGGPGQLSCDDPALPSSAAPTQFGACADCHAPGIDGVAGGRDLHDALGVGFDEGVTCDVCHKVSEVDLTQPPGVAGRLVLRRPTEPSPAVTLDWEPVYFGPLIDVPNGFMGASYQPQFKEALYCAGCHEQKQPALVMGQSLDPKRWPDGLPIHSTYQEWLDGPYGASDTPCQFCHMPAQFDMNNSIGTSTPENASITFGYPRPPEDIRSHSFRGPLDPYGDEPRLIDSALFTSVQLTLDGSEVEASVSLANIGCGHALPTGEPMRALILRVSAEGTGCGARPATGGDTVFDVGGAHRRGILGGEVTVTGADLTWTGSGAAIGMIVRAVRPAGSYDDYPGIGHFADPGLSPMDKGLERHHPVGEASVLALAGDTITLDAALPLQAGDVVFLADPAAGPTPDASPSRALAGAPGYAFARVLVDADGLRQAPHHRAVDITSDNRIPPGQAVQTTHRFAVDPSCADVTVTAEVIYRPHPLALALERAWDARDYVIDGATATLALP